MTGLELTAEETVLLHDIFAAARWAQATHDTPFGNYTTRTERLVAELARSVAERADA